MPRPDTAPRPILTGLDRAIGYFAPRAALRRAHARLTLREVAQVAATRGYDAARVSRRTDGWTATSGSANAEVGPALHRIRARTRDAVRNNPLASSAVAKLSTYMVGTGLRASPRTTDPAERARIREDWARFDEECDPEGLRSFGAIQMEVARCVVESGEALVQIIPRPSRDGLRVPIQLRVLEPDHIDLSQTRVLPGGGAIIQGVEFDAAGRRVAYWLHDEHPGDVVWRTAGQARRVAAKWILPVFDIRRPGQVHGVPWFAPVLMKMRDVDDLDDARLVKKKIEACFAAFVTKQNPDGPLTTPTTDDRTGNRLESMAPGAIYYLGEDEAVSFANPSGSEGDAEWLTMQLHLIAAGLGLPYHGLTGDLRQANYSSLRAGKLDLWAQVDVWQAHMIAHQLCRPVWRRVDDLLVAMGRRSRSIGADWIAPERAMVDPQKDGAAIQRDLRMGRRTLAEAVRARGRDWDEHLAELAAVRDALAASGLVLDSDPSQTTTTGQARAAGGSPAEADAPEVTEEEDADDA
jgi:lambda family phage portal protein